MDKKAVLEIISAFRNALESQGMRAEKIILFGSYATGQYRQDNDIDVAVISQDFEHKNYWQRIDILSGAIYEIFEPIEATAFTPDEWQSRKSIIADFAPNGEVVYG